MEREAEISGIELIVVRANQCLRGFRKHGLRKNRGMNHESDESYEFGLSWPGKKLVLTRVLGRSFLFRSRVFRPTGDEPRSDMKRIRERNLPKPISPQPQLFDNPELGLSQNAPLRTKSLASRLNRLSVFGGGG